MHEINTIEQSLYMAESSTENNEDSLDSRKTESFTIMVQVSVLRIELSEDFLI